MPFEPFLRDPVLFSQRIQVALISDCNSAVLANIWGTPLGQSFGILSSFLEF